MTVDLPSADTLSKDQLRGATCVRCGIALTAGHVVDLGPRPLPTGCGDWFPRECLTHSASECAS